MTNAPENFESYVLPDDVEKVEYTSDVQVLNCGTYKIEREDHTLANLLRMQLLRDRDVIFVGYRHPHPIQHHILLRIQTASVSTSGAPYYPSNALTNALSDLNMELSDIKSQFKAALQSNPQQ